MLAQYTLSWVICSNQTLPVHESHPRKGRLIHISERKNILFFLTALAGTWCKAAAFLPYLENFPISFWKTIPWGFVNSFSTPALGPLSKPCLNSVIVSWYHLFWSQQSHGGGIGHSFLKCSGSCCCPGIPAALLNRWTKRPLFWAAERCNHTADLQHLTSTAELNPEVSGYGETSNTKGIWLCDKEGLLSQSNHVEANRV